MRTLQIIIEALLALIAFGLWVCNGFRLPKYVHWLAAIALFFGGFACYEIILLGNGIVSILWVPFLFAGVVYIVFILHGVGLPSEKEIKQATEEWKKAMETAEEEETEGEEPEPRIEIRG